MKESRASCYGENLTYFINYIIHNQKNPEQYKRIFIRELKDYSLEGKTREAPPNKGCVWELENINNLDVENPQTFSKNNQRRIAFNVPKTN